MSFSNPPAGVLRKLLTDARTIAVVGASSKPHRASHGIFQKLLSAGYRVIPVNPYESEVLGQQAYPSLETVPGKVDIVDVFRRADETPAIAASAVSIGAGALWLQQGIANEEAAARALAGGLTVVMDECIGVAHAILQIPRVIQ
ncbi:MAG TPA: CoA-binding protein [Gemmatimonadaceae bacterium]|nr:CoA-binding protein [Gemmatimonadaceae bacterium]